MSERSERIMGSVRRECSEQSGPRGFALRPGPFVAERSEAIA